MDREITIHEYARLSGQPIKMVMRKIHFGHLRTISRRGREYIRLSKWRYEHYKNVRSENGG